MTHLNFHIQSLSKRRKNINDHYSVEYLSAKRPSTSREVDIRNAPVAAAEQV